MPPDVANEACPAGEEETPMLGKEDADAAHLRKTSTKTKRKRSWRLPPKDAVKPLVLIDMFAVSIVVSLLQSYFRDLNISSEQYGLVTSAYNSAQIVGGFVLGALSDRAMSRRSVLILSFLGSALSYGTIGISKSLNMLLAGRVVVGLVKQTMTIATAIVSENTSTDKRSGEIAKLTSVVSISWLVGSSFGSFLYQRNKKLPPMVASSLFLLNSVLALILLPSGHPRSAGSNMDAPAVSKKKDDPASAARNNERGEAGSISSGDVSSATSRFWQNLKKACRSGPVLRILSADLMFNFLMRSLSAQSHMGYFEERFGVESWAAGYIQSYKIGLGFFVQVCVIGRLTSWRSETTLVTMSLAAVTMMNLAEGAPSIFGLWGYLVLLVPMGTVANSTLRSCLQSMFTQRVPQGDLGAALGVLNVLHSASGVVAPLYGGKLIGSLGVMARPTLTAAHYAVFCVLWWAMEMTGASAAAGSSSSGSSNSSTSISGSGSASFLRKKVD